MDPRSVLLAACLPLLTGGCHPAPKPDREPIRPTPRSRAAPSAAPDHARAVELSIDGPVQVDARERIAAPGGGVLIGAWPRRAARIDLDEQAAPVRTVLQRFARVSRLNFVLHDEVRGEVTAAVSGVPWTQALRVVLAAKDLVAVLEGNVVRVLPRSQWQRERGAATR